LQAAFGAVSLRDYLLQLLLERTFRGWRTIRPSWREVVMAVVVVCAIILVAYLIYWSGIENHCLWDKLGARCQNGG
jgi:hypothetical protein